jgi:hypothetical protein
MPDAELLEHTLVQLHDLIAADAAAALSALQSVIATSPPADRTLSLVELDLLRITIAIERARQLLDHAVQVLAGPELPGGTR